MLLVLAHPEDKMATAFAEYAKAKGICCNVVHDWCDIDASITADRTAGVKVDLRCGRDKIPVTAVLNRGVSLESSNVSVEEQFRSSEVLATWWSVLTYFPGPVVNRPSRFGFIPNVDLFSIAASLPNIALPYGSISSHWKNPPSSSLVNVHRLCDNQYLGYLDDVYPCLNESDIYIFTPFNPSNVTRILIAGDEVIDLAYHQEYSKQERLQFVDPIAAELRRRNATFSLITIERQTNECRLLHATSFPGLHYYHHIVNYVHDALLEYLIQ